MGVAFLPDCPKKVSGVMQKCTSSLEGVNSCQRMATPVFLNLTSKWQYQYFWNGALPCDFHSFSYFLTNTWYCRSLSFFLMSVVSVHFAFPWVLEKLKVFHVSLFCVFFSFGVCKKIPMPTLCPFFCFFWRNLLISKRSLHTLNKRSFGYVSGLLNVTAFSSFNIE